MPTSRRSASSAIVMKIVLAFVAAIWIGIATLILGLIIVIPSIGLGILAVLSGQTAGLTWNAHTIALAVVIGCVLLAIFLYLVSLISVPAIVFFPAYSIYFFAGRYPRLSAALHSASPPSPGSSTCRAPFAFSSVPAALSCGLACTLLRFAQATLLQIRGHPPRSWIKDA